MRFSTIVLSGGKSTRMGRDKAFLRLGGQTFLSRVVGEAAKVSKEILVVVGLKEASGFAKKLPKTVSVLADSYHISNPLGGMLSGFDSATNKYAAVLACDLPLVRSEVIRFIASQALGHSAAVPMWDNGNLEPLCAVYRVSEARRAAMVALAEGRLGPKQVILSLGDVKYVPVSWLRRYDRDLDSLTNVNTQTDYERVRERYRQALGASDWR